MKTGRFIKKAILLGLIGFVGLSCGTNHPGVVYAAGRTEVQSTAQAASGQAIGEETSGLYPVRIKTNQEVRSGYIDGTGKLILKPVYIEAGNFTEGYAVVYSGNKYQMINQSGEVIFETAGALKEFHNGLAAFSDPDKNYKQGYINTKGTVVIQPKYDFAGAFRTDGTAVVTETGTIRVINKNGKILKSYAKSSIYLYENITDIGNCIISNKFTLLKGVVSIDGKVIIKPIYGEVIDLGEGLFGVKKAPANIEAYKISIKPAAIFDQKGKQLTTFQFYDLSSFNNGYASATDSRYTYIIDTNGKKATSLPKLEGRGNAKVLGDIIQAEIDNETIYLKTNGSVIWKNDGISRFSSGITVSTAKLRPNKYVLVNYPVVDGIGDANVQTIINQNLKSLFTDSRSKLKENDELFVTDEFTVKQIKDLLIINKTGYDYPVGAAHGMPLSFYYFVNVKTGDFYQLSDLFKKNSDYVSVLSKSVYRQIQKRTKDGYVYYYDGKSLIDKNQFFRISKDTLTIYFDSGAIASYAEGFVEFDIPFKDIMSIINTDGAFWKVFHK